jgi:hypothetical protein
MDATQNFQTGKRIQATVQPATVWHRVDMTTHEERLFRVATQSHPEIAGFVTLRFGTYRARFFFQPTSRLRPEFGKRDALRAVLIAR